MRQLQHLVTDEAAIECYDMFLAESKNKATGGFCSQAQDRQVAELIYQKRAEKLLADEKTMTIKCNGIELTYAKPAKTSNTEALAHSSFYTRMVSFSLSR